MEVLSQKGKQILYFEGYRYRKDKSFAGTTHWRCSRTGCKGRVISQHESDIKKNTTPHNHAPNPAQEKIDAFKTNLKRRSKENIEIRPRNIIGNNMNNLNEEEMISLLSYSASKQVNNRLRHSEGSSTTSFASATDVIILEKHKKTSSGEIFLLHDFVDQKEKRILIFGTPTNLRILAEFKNWAVDGTFKIAPQCFLQLYTIHALINNKAVPMIFALLEDKRMDSYNHVFKKILELEPAAKPESVVTDFEPASINAIKSTFPEVELVGCHFHLSQSLWRNIQKKGMTDMYREREEIRMCCKMLLALSFVPPRDVQFALELINEDFPEEIRSIVDYWEETYVGRRIHHVLPKFSIDLWNLYDRVLEDLPKTNNSVEAWHNAFQNALDCQHPTVHRLFDQIQNEQNKSEVYITRYRAGIRECETKKKYFIQKTRLRHIVEEYSFRNVKQYLRSVALNLSL